LIKWTEYLKGRFGKLRKKEKYLREGERNNEERRKRTENEKKNRYESHVSSLSTYRMLRNFKLLIDVSDQSTLLLRNLLTSRVTEKEPLNAWHTLNRAFLVWQNLEKLY